VTGPARMKELPGVPTFGEVNLPRVNFMSHWGMLGPKALPKDIVDKINAATRRAVDDAKVRQRIEESGAVVVAGSPQEFGKEIKELYTELKKVVVERKLTTE